MTHDQTNQALEEMGLDFSDSALNATGAPGMTAAVQHGSHINTLMPVVPQTYGEAIQLYPWLTCDVHEWDNRTTAENAVWLIGELRAAHAAAQAQLQALIEGLPELVKAGIDAGIAYQRDPMVRKPVDTIIAEWRSQCDSPATPPENETGAESPRNTNDTLRSLEAYRYFLLAMRTPVMQKCLESLIDSSPAAPGQPESEADKQ